MTSSGFIGLAGRPNVGKSTLVNAIVGSHVAIVSVRPQTTRRAIRGVATDLEAERQLVLVDLPGVQRPRDVLDRADAAAGRARAGRLRRRPGGRSTARRGSAPATASSSARCSAPAPELPVDLRRQQGRPARPERDRSRSSPPPPSCPGSTRSSRSAPAPARGSAPLVERLGELMPEGPYMYPPEDHSDQSSELLLAELIREQVLNRTRQEIPHSVEVKVKEVAPREDGLVTVAAEIWAETESQKGILIGKGGAKIGEIGTAARRSLERELERQGPPRPQRPRAPPLAPRRGPAGPARDRVAAPATTIGPMFGEIEFDQRGLAPCVVQDWATGEVLMLGLRQRGIAGNDAGDRRPALPQPLPRRTLEKGESSGSFMHLRQLRYDCDGDALVAMVDPAGPACHTGQRSCFYREVLGSASSRKDAPPAPGEPFPVTYEALPALERTLRSRAVERPDGSYTVEAARRPHPDRREGRGGGRGGHPRRPRGDRRARRRRGRRPALPPQRAAGLARGLAGGGDGSAECP